MISEKRERGSALLNGSAPKLAEAAPGRGLLKERAYEELRRLIVSGRLAAGTFLTERQLAVQLGMSKTPVRSALERLESEGFVRISPQQGAIIRDLSIHEIADQYEIRAALESFVVRSIAGRLTPEQVAALEANLDAQKANLAAAGVERGVILDEEFHVLFGEFLGNREVLRVMRQLRDKIHRVIYQVFQSSRERIATSYHEHRAIADAVIQGNAELAASRLEAHLDYGKNALLSPRRG
jgi:DNA-binding GntR family transcriptional regulator